MQATWSREYVLRANDFDKYDHLLPSTVLSIFQDAAGQHGEEIGVGFESMLSRSYLWVVVRLKFEVIKAPVRHQRVMVKTWPLEPKRFSYRREYKMSDMDGNALIIGSSEWVVIDSNKRNLVSAPDLYEIKDGFCTDMLMDKKIGKVPDFEPNTPPYIVTPGYTELDMNNHVNNTKYANYVLDALNPRESDIIKTFQMDYRKEVVQGTKLSVFANRGESEVLAKGLNDNGDVMFACKIELN